VARKPRNVLKLKSGEELANGERVAKGMRPAFRNSASGA
jgi:hypothetical protein